MHTNSSTSPTSSKFTQPAWATPRYNLERKISYHGGHNYESCLHADQDSTVTNIAQERIKQGFTHFGFSEHLTAVLYSQPRKTEYLYAEEIEAQFSKKDFLNRLKNYCRQVRKMQKRYKDQASILLGIETEVVGDHPFDFINKFRLKNNLDYIVGSVHHVNNIPIDINKELYQQAINTCGNLEKLYVAYYETVQKLINHCKPEIIGHLDLIKIFSPDFQPNKKIQSLIKNIIGSVIEYGGMFEVNTRAYKKNLQEPYPSGWIMQKILQANGEITLSDDAHGPADVSYRYADGLQYIIQLGFKKISALEMISAEPLNINDPLKRFKKIYFPI